MIDNQFAGLNGFVWWVGVVESRQDPLKLGRCKVRIFGWHSENVTEVPTDLLPWSQAMMPLNNANPYTPKESDVVVGFFLDGENAQTPIMMGVLPGIPLNKANPQQGFNDTRTSKQLVVAPAKPNQEKNPYPRNLDEPTTSRLARNENPTQIELLNQLASKGNKYFVAKPPSYNARYPYNNAIETESGHAFELDDTPDYERINIMHRGGSHLEFRPEGSVQQKVMNNSTRMIEGDETVHIKGNKLVYIDGDLTYIVGGSVTYQVEKDFSVSAKNVTFNARGSFSADAKVSASLSGIISSSLGGLTSIITSVDGVKTDVSGMASLDASSFGKATFGGSATIINGGTIALVNIPGSAEESSASKSEPPEAGSPFTSPTVAPNITETATESIDNAIATYGVPNPKASDIIGTSVSNKSYLDNVLYGPTSYNWTNPVSITQNMSAVNPSFADSLIKDMSRAKASLTDYITKLPEDLYQKSGLIELEKGYDDAIALSKTAISSGKVSDYGKAGKASVALIGTGAKVGVNISGFNKDVINASQFVKDSCLLKTGKQFVKDLSQPLIDAGDKLREDLKAMEDGIKDLDPKLKERLSELRKSIDSFDEKALDEFINANHKDAACQRCANEAYTKLRIEGVDRKTVSEGVSNCLYKEYSEFKKTYASKIPITDKTAADNLNNSC